MSAGHRFDCTLTIGTTALCNAAHSFPWKRKSSPWFLPSLKRYFSCASTVTNRHDSFSSSYESLQIVPRSQFLRVVTIGQLLVTIELYA